MGTEPGQRSCAFLRGASYTPPREAFDGEAHPVDVAKRPGATRRGHGHRRKVDRSVIDSRFSAGATGTTVLRGLVWNDPVPGGPGRFTPTGVHHAVRTAGRRGLQALRRRPGGRPGELRG